MKPDPADVIRKLTDPLGVAAWMLEEDTDDPIRDGYAPRGVDLRDFTILRHTNSWHLVYTDFRLNQHSRTPGQGAFLSHAVSKNLVDWRSLGPVLHVRPGEWDGRALWAPYLVKHRNEFHMFYTGLNEHLSQRIGHATSTDMHSFERHPASPVLVPDQFDWCLWTGEGLANCRDPHVLRVGDRFYLYYTALCKTGEVCVAAAESADLIDWADTGPVIRAFPATLDTSPVCLESSCVHPCRGGYVLSYSYDRSIWINFSSNHLSFDPAHSVRVLNDHLGLEKVLEISEHAWLVAYFSQIARGRPSRLFFGMLELDSRQPKVRPLGSRKEMEQILSSV